MRESTGVVRYLPALTPAPKPLTPPVTKPDRPGSDAPGHTLGPRPTTGPIANAERVLDLAQIRFEARIRDAKVARADRDAARVRLVAERIRDNRCPHCGVKNPPAEHICAGGS